MTPMMCPSCCNDLDVHSAHDDGVVFVGTIVYCNGCDQTLVVASVMGRAGLVREDMMISDNVRAIPIKGPCPTVFSFGPYIGRIS